MTSLTSCVSLFRIKPNILEIDRTIIDCLRYCYGLRWWQYNIISPDRSTSTSMDQNSIHNRLAMWFTSGEIYCYYFAVSGFANLGHQDRKKCLLFRDNKMLYFKYIYIEKGTVIINLDKLPVTHEALAWVASERAY